MVARGSKLLRRTLDETRKLTETTGGAPASGSDAAEEWPEKTHHVAYSGIFTLLTAAGEQINATATLIDDERIFAWAPMPSGRAAVELSARAWWLAAPDLTASERRARGYALWHKALWTTRNLPGMAESMADLDAQLLGRLQDDGVPHTAKDGIVTKIHEAAWTGAGGVLDDLYGDQKYARAVYSWLSGVSHGDPWILAESFQHLHGDDGTGTIVTTANTRLVGVLVEAIVRAYVGAIDRWSDRMGWSETWEPWGRYLRKQASEIRGRLD